MCHISLGIGYRIVFSAFVLHRPFCKRDKRVNGTTIWKYIIFNPSTVTEAFFFFYLWLPQINIQLTGLLNIPACRNTHSHCVVKTICVPASTFSCICNVHLSNASPGGYKCYNKNMMWNLLFVISLKGKICDPNLEIFFLHPQALQHAFPLRCPVIKLADRHCYTSST